MKKVDKYTDKVEKLLNKRCYIIDYLPMRVPKDSDGSYFDVEYYLLNSKKRKSIKNKVVSVILKLMCYYKTVVLWGDWIENPEPERVEKIVNKIMKNYSGSIDCLFPEIDMYLTFSWDSLNIDIYNPSKDVISLLEKIASSEGMFFREGL